ncbi:MAG: beta strand repeat-containing protein [Nocardioides sp.]|uniref:beta strand repeat-containing protein n=1 Tax=Nocardioides sp. TaxID=35761 RepID=UPI003F06A094
MKMHKRFLARVGVLALVASPLALVPTTAQAALANCKASTLGVTVDTTTTSDMNSDLPSKVYVGSAARTVNLSSNSVIKYADIKTAVSLLGAKRIGGNSDPTILLNGGSPVSAPVVFAPAVIVENQDINVTAVGSFSWTPPATPQTVAFSTGRSYSAKTEIYNSLTSTSPSNSINASCTVSADQDTTFAQVDVVSRSTTSLVLSSASIQQGADTSTATATVAVDAGTVAGTVVFAVDGVDRPAVTVASGKATLALPRDLSVGDHAVTARFVPANTTLYEPSTSAASTLAVTPPATTTSTSLALTPNPASANAPVGATATVTPSGAVGQVQFQVDGATVETVAVSGGTATAQLPGQPQGEYLVKARFVPTQARDFTASESAGETLTVTKAATATSATLSLTRTTAAATDVVRASSVVAPSTAAGRVEFRVGSTVIGEGTVSSGRVQQATLDVTGLAPGQHQVVAHFVPAVPTSFAASQSSPVTLTITPPAEPTTTTLQLSAATATATADVTATATVAPSGATGQVEFTVDGKSVTATVSGGTATAVLPKVTAGSYDVTARFTPTGSVYAGSVSAAAQLVVTEVATSTALQLSTTSGVSGDVVRATATLTPASAQGTVTFAVDGTSTTATVANGVATVDLPALPVGTHSVTASFASVPAGVHAASQSEPVSLTMAEPVQARATTTTLTLADTTVSKGAAVPVSATVTADGATPLGSVVFTAGSTQVSAPLVDGSASAALTGLEIGDHDVTARFVPTQAQVFAASTSASVRLTVVRPAAVTHTSVTLTPSEATVGQSVKAIASVSSENGAPAGQVRFTVGDQTALVTVADRIATWTFPAPVVGQYTVRAEFVPARPVEQKASEGTATLTTSVPDPVRTVTGFALSTDRVVVGASATATATVQATTGTPAGRVVFTVDGEEVSAEVTNGRATATLPDTLGEGVYEVAARFAPALGSGFAPSTAASRTLVVEVQVASAAPTQTLLSLPSSQVAEGAAPTANVTVVSTAGTPAGSVQVLVDGVSRRTAALAGGSASVTLPADLAVGQHTVVARFVPADETVHAASASTSRTLVVTAPSRVQTITSLSLDPGTVELGSAARATARVAAASGTPSGSVEFTVDGRVLAATLDDGQAAVDLPGDLAQGSYAVEATYVPSGTVHGASTTSALLTVRDSDAGAKATSTALTLSTSSALAGELVSATVQVTAQGTTPTGQVRVQVGDTVLEAPLLGGVAVVSLPPLAAGSHTVSAELIGNDAFSASAATPATLTVTPAATPITVTTTSLTVDASTLRAGQAVGVSATVSPNAAGQVRFSAGWTAVTVPVTNGTARASLPAMSAGEATVTATFIPTDSTRVGASWDTSTVTVGKAVSTVTLTGRHAKKGKTLSLKAKVATLAPGGTCDTRAQFVVKVGAKAVRKVLVPVSCTGVATRNITVPTAKAYTVVVTFRGNTQVAASKVTKVFKAQR